MGQRTCAICGYDVPTNELHQANKCIQYRIEKALEKDRAARR
jgi:hypothetical protein